MSHVPIRERNRRSLRLHLYETRPTWLNTDTGEVRFDLLADAFLAWQVPTTTVFS